MPRLPRSSGLYCHSMQKSPVPKSKPALFALLTYEPEPSSNNAAVPNFGPVVVQLGCSRERQDRSALICRSSRVVRTIEVDQASDVVRYGRLRDACDCIVARLVDHPTCFIGAESQVSSNSHCHASLPR